ncbi:MAG: hypothetical protein AAFP82_05990 [Bacteroidota bacterium]
MRIFKFILLISILVSNTHLFSQTPVLSSEDVWIKNNGSSSSTSKDNNGLNVKGGTAPEVTYLKFTLPTFSSLSTIELELSTSSNSFGDVAVYWVDDNSWSHEFSADNSPASSTLVSIGTPSKLGNKVTWVLSTSQFANRSGQTISLSLEKSGTTRISFASQENGDGDETDPKLLLTTSGSGGSTCSDGVQNGMETGVDCGGPDCPACPTCSDGIQNGMETGVDCGGPDCNGCPPTCDDNIQNGDEEGIDCGGSSCPDCPDPGNGGSLWMQNGNKIYYNTGNVGVGTNDPSELFHVAGQIYAVNVRVSTDAGADFVFQEGYEFLTLEELERYVKLHKHLPDIPSEQEMIENDLQLGEFSIKLLQKIEELTLYMIEMKKENSQLKTANMTIQKEIEELRKRINDN